MKNYLLLISLLLALSAFRCDRRGGFELGQPFRLQIGEKVRCAAHGGAIQLIAFKEDSRCPEFTNCLWEGQVVVQLLIDGDQPQYIDLGLREGHPQLASKKVGAYIYRLRTVTPYPQAGKDIAPEEYVIELIVESI
jgi:hypothetical protein